MVESAEHRDLVSRGLASEAIQALRSHDALDTLRFENMDKQYNEIKELIEATNKKIDDGFKSYDGKFWSLAITTITLLATAVAALLIRVIFK
jgi:hypothetical protein